MYDTIIKNAKIIDGTGRMAFISNLGIKDGTIYFTDEESEAINYLDAQGLYVTPGFIDAHSHGDMVFGQDFAKLCKISQGITTEVCGQCGSSLFPVNKGTLPLLKRLLAVGTNSFSDDMENWKTFKRYKKYLEKVDLVSNTIILTGHAALRIAVMGYDARKATDEELTKMKVMLREAMENGSLGLSTGLIYPPGCYADIDEIVELCKIVSEFDGIYATHMSNEAYYVTEAVKQAIEIGRRANVRVEISHHKICGKSNWGKSSETLKLVNDAIKAGQKITIDQYPYNANMTHLNVCIPPKYFDHGILGMTEWLKDTNNRSKIIEEMTDVNGGYDNFYLNCGGWKNVYISYLPNTPEYAGMFVSEYAKKVNKEPFNAYFDLLIQNNGEGAGIYFSMSEDDIINIFKNENTVVGTDGLCKSMNESGHPRAWGTFTHAICYFNKEKKITTLEETVRKMTSLPAERLMLKNKGIIANGKDADLVIFDYDELKDMATYKDSNNVTKGIKYVIVNGQIVYEDYKLTGIYPGKVISHIEN